MKVHNGVKTALVLLSLAVILAVAQKKPPQNQQPKKKQPQKQEEIKDGRLDKLKIDCKLRTSKEMLQKDKACFDKAAPEDYKKKWKDCKVNFGLSDVADTDFLPMWCKKDSDKVQFLQFNDCISDLEVFKNDNETEIKEYFKTYQACEDKYFDAKKHYAKLQQ